MARHAESWVAADELDYVKGANVEKSHAYQAYAATITGALPALVGKKDGRPTVQRPGAATNYVIGAITHVGNKGCRVVERGRFLLRAASAYTDSDLNKTVTATGTAGVVEAADRAVNLNNSLNIVGGGDDVGGIGDYYIIEKL